ncbi:MAG: hypothetical protein Q4C64_05690, partial [Erysipelotrichia bacterium]|nr:hypothetical protein [Erysipelotrichia bacterium]
PGSTVQIENKKYEVE